MIWLTFGMNLLKTKWLPQPFKKIAMVVVWVIFLIKSPPTLWWWSGDLLFLLSPPAAAPPLFSALTRKPLLGLFPNICSMHTGPGEFAW